MTWPRCRDPEAEVTAKLALGALVAFTSCAAVDYVADHGSVYECASADGVLELCTDLDRAELEQATGWQCKATERLWPKLTGCIYSCEPGHVGCNATSGCWGCL